MYRAALFAASLALFCNAASAKDLGVRGEVFPIAEPDFFSEIQARFNRLEAAGEVDRMQREMQARALASAERPPRNESLSRTLTPRAYHFDPTITVADDITTPDGTVIARAGDRFNPLDYTPMAQTLLFFDGDDAEQVAWAASEVEAATSQVSPILIGGPVLELTRQWRRQVFYDQGGKLVDQFGIVQVPARITRDGDRLLIEEVTP